MIIASGMTGPISPATGARCRGKGPSAITPPSVSARRLWHGNFGAARYFDWRRRHEQAEINAERRDIARDRQHLAYERFQRDIDIAHRNYDEGRYR